MRLIAFYVVSLLLIMGSFYLGRASVESPSVVFIGDAKEQLPDFLVVAKSLAKSIEYSNDYNCVNFSTRLAEEYESMGYDAKVVSGWYSSDPYCKINDSLLESITVASALNSSCIQGHAWVEVTIPIEAVTGNMISVGDYKR